MGLVSNMDEKFDPVSAELDQLTDEEIEARLAAAIDSRALEPYLHLGQSGVQELANNGRESERHSGEAA